MGLVSLVAATAIATVWLLGLMRRHGPRHPFRVGSPEADASTLTALRRAGADLTRETDVVFRLQFAERAQAERAAATISGPAFVAAVEPTGNAAQWICRVRARMVPSLSAIRDASIRVQAVAATMGGRYDGWDAAVERAAATIHEVNPAPGDMPLASPPVNALVKWFVALVMYVRGPRRLFLNQRVAPSRPPTRLSPLDEAGMPAELRTYLSETDRALAALGFASPLHVSMSPTTAGVTAYASLLEHPDQQAITTVFATRNTRGGTTAGLIFRSERADGLVVLTSNIRARRRFPRPPGHDAMTFPEVVDPATLLRIHRFRLRERPGAAPPRSVTRQPDPIAYQLHEAEQTRAQWLRIGYYRSLADGTLRPTLRGAVCLSWRGMFPWAQLTDARDARARRAQLARYATAQA